jgi:hypothetical protein
MPLDPCGFPEQDRFEELDNAPDRCQPEPSLKETGDILDEPCEFTHTAG